MSGSLVAYACTPGGSHSMCGHPSGLTNIISAMAWRETIADRAIPLTLLGAKCLCTAQCHNPARIPPL